MSNVTLPPKTPVDLYAATGIAVGTVITASNLGTGDIRLSTSELGLQDDYIPLNAYEQAVNKATDPGAWAYSVGGAGVNVKES